jgi:tetratricopeptide (TPR) repeat protein
MIIRGLGLHQRARLTRRRAWVGALAAVVGALSVTAPTSAAAQTEESTHNAAAEALFRDGVSLAKAGKFEEAAAKFEASFALDPARGTLLGWAMAEERAGKLASAWGHYQELRDLARTEGDQERARVATNKIRELSPRVPTVTVTASGRVPAGTRIILDGKPLRQGGLGSPLPVDPGDHELRAVSPDGSRFERRLSLAEGGHETVAIELARVVRDEPPVAAPPGEPSPTVEQPQSTWTTWQTTGAVMGAVGVVALGVGTYFWFNAGAIYDEVESDCPNRVCPPDEQARIDDGRQQESIGRIALIAGGVSTALGIGLIWFGGNSQASAPRDVAIRLGPGSLVLDGTF